MRGQFVPLPTPINTFNHLYIGRGIGNGMRERLVMEGGNGRISLTISLNHHLQLLIFWKGHWVWKGHGVRLVIEGGNERTISPTTSLNHQLQPLIFWKGHWKGHEVRLVMERGNERKFHSLPPSITTFNRLYV